MTVALHLDAREVRRAVDGQWRHILGALGIDDSYLTGRHGPCPMCGGRDRWRFTDHHGAGMWWCNWCGTGDGIALVMTLHHLTFSAALREIAAVVGLTPLDGTPKRHTSHQPTSAPRPRDAQPAYPTARVKALRRTCAAPGDVPDVVEYLTSRRLWPLPDGCTLRGHAGAEYWDDGALAGRFPALVADVVDVDGELVTCHITYLQNGRKLEGHPPRKILGPMTGRRGCSVRLMPCPGDTLGITEGIETGLAAHRIHDLPVWAALNTSVLAKFQPPPGVHHVVIFADRDAPGLEAAWALREELDGRCSVELCTPPAPAKDWAETLEARA